MKNFWETLRNIKQETGKPFFVLAPMADVTDPAFRSVVAKYSRHGETGGGPDVLWTEFVSADGLCHPVGGEKLKRDLSYTETERPIVAQLFSSKPENMRIACRICAEMGFDGIDINMGCPDRTIEKQGCGSAMIKNRDNAIEIIHAAKQGIIDSGCDIPLSVKTRVGYYQPDIENWIGTLLRQNITCLTVHARTRKDLSVVPANWDYIQQVVQLRDRIAPHTVIIGNGDVTDMSDGDQKSRDTGCDGIMIGRAIFGNPWLFDRNRVINQQGSWRISWWMKLFPRSIMKRIMGDRRYTIPQVDITEKLRVLVEHSELYMELLGDIKGFAIMKKHYKAYCTGFPGARELRSRLMETSNVGQVRDIVDEFLEKM